MKRTAKERNARDNQHRTEEIDAKKDYSQEASPYHDWRENNEGYDMLDMDEIADNDPRLMGPVLLSEMLATQWEGFEDVYPLLSGRQREAATLLLQGQWRQEAIAIQMGISQQAVANLLLKIRRKIEKYIGRQKD